MLDLSDFNLKLIYVSGKDLSSPDALSWHPDYIPKFDNNSKGVTLLPQFLFVNLINTKLSAKIPKSPEKDPLVLNTLQALEWEVLTQFQSSLPNWSYEARILAYQRQVYVPDKDNLCKELLIRFHDHNVGIYFSGSNHYTSAGVVVRTTKLNSNIKEAKKQRFTVQIPLRL